MISSESSSMFSRPLDLESMSGRFDSLQNPPSKKNLYMAHHSWKTPATNTFSSDTSDTWGLWLGFLFCFIFVFLLIFVLWYPADYYYYNGMHPNDKNMNGVPDNREFRAYHYSPYYTHW